MHWIWTKVVEQNDSRCQGRKQIDKALEAILLVEEFRVLERRDLLQGLMLKWIELSKFQFQFRGFGWVFFSWLSKEFCLARRRALISDGLKLFLGDEFVLVRNFREKFGDDSGRGWYVNA